MAHLVKLFLCEPGSVCLVALAAPLNRVNRVNVLRSVRKLRLIIRVNRNSYAVARPLHQTGTERPSFFFPPLPLSSRPSYVAWRDHFCWHLPYSSTGLILLLWFACAATACRINKQLLMLERHQDIMPSSYSRHLWLCGGSSGRRIEYGFEYSMPQFCSEPDVNTSWLALSATWKAYHSFAGFS